MDFQPDQNPSTKRIDRYYYSMTDLLGKGAFGTVYLGHDIDNKQQLYAIKVIPVSLIDTDPQLKESLLNEMQVMKLLNHVNIVHCYDVLSSANNHYFVMEYCSGGTLAGYLKKKKGKLPESEALTILIQMLKGYHEMLKLGIIHRDLKPDNILFHDDIFKLADFGFAKCVENFSKDLMKSLVGTPLYMSPQILQHIEYTTKSDLWSIALIYYEMLCGKTPWDAKTQFELVNKILHQPVKFPNDIMISEESKSFILGALKVEEHERLSWDEVFSHTLFNDCFDYKRRKTTLKEKAINYQAMLKTKIIEKNIDLFKLFSVVDKNNNNELEMNEFAELMKKLDDKITREQIEFIYNSIDEDGNNSISLYEFRKWLSNSPNNASSNSVLQRVQSIGNPVSPNKTTHNNSNFTKLAKMNSMSNNNISPNNNVQMNPNMPMNNNIPPTNSSPMQNTSKYNQNNQTQGFQIPQQPQPQPQGYMQGSQGYNMPPPQYNQNYNMYNNTPNPSGQNIHPSQGIGINQTQFNPYNNQNIPYVPQGGFGAQNPNDMYNNPNQYNFANPQQIGIPYQQNQYGYNIIPMAMQGPYKKQENKNVTEIIGLIRGYIHKTQSNVEKLFNLARGDKQDLDKSQFIYFINMMNFTVAYSEYDLDTVFMEFDLDKDGRISYKDFSRIIFNT